MFGNLEFVFSGFEAWGPPSGGPPSITIQQTVFWPGGRGVLLLDAITLENGATLRLNVIGTPGGSLPRLGDLERDADIIDPDCWHFDLPAETQLGFLVTLPAADVDPPGRAVLSMTIQRTEP